MSSYLLSALKENTIPPSEFRSSKGILSQTLGKQSPYSTLGLRPRVEYENSSPRVWERILILLPPSEGGMYYTTPSFGGRNVLYYSLLRGEECTILSQTPSKQSLYSTLGLWSRMEYENSSPRVWERILILLPPSEAGMTSFSIWMSYFTMCLKRIYIPCILFQINIVILNT